jgi:hypothetical protein
VSERIMNIHVSRLRSGHVIKVGPNGREADGRQVKLSEERLGVVIMYSNSILGYSIVITWSIK